MAALKPLPDKPDFESARLHALQRLSTELPDYLRYHSVAHTRDDVVPAATRLADIEGVAGEDRLLLLSAAWYHDIGFVVRYEDNEEFAVQIARQALPRFGYNSEQLEVIEGIIMATRLPQTPHNLLEAIIADADLDVLGTPEFFDRNLLLRDELAVLDRLTNADTWVEDQLTFLQGHRYFTAAAQATRQPGKERNIAILLQQLADIKSPKK